MFGWMRWFVAKVLALQKIYSNFSEWYSKNCIVAKMWCVACSSRAMHLQFLCSMITESKQDVIIIIIIISTTQNEKGDTNRSLIHVGTCTAIVMVQHALEWFVARCSLFYRILFSHRLNENEHLIWFIPTMDHVWRVHSLVNSSTGVLMCKQDFIDKNALQSVAMRQLANENNTIRSHMNMNTYASYYWQMSEFNPFFPLNKFIICYSLHFLFDILYQMVLIL